jgi:hypothetical protein
LVLFTKKITLGHLYNKITSETRVMTYIKIVNVKQI